MQNFELRRDRFHFFESFEKPLLNITFRLEIPNFLEHCKEQNKPPFHFFLYHVTKSLSQIENFLYRQLDGQIFKIDKIVPSYTTLSTHNLFNYTHLVYCDDQYEFIQRSLAAKVKVMNETKLLNAGFDLTPRELKNHFFITSIPWLDFTAIEHPVFRFKSADIPSIAWGKFKVRGNLIEIPFAVQAHHGFVDAYHIHLLAQSLEKSIRDEIIID